jgi:hypothetical protein
MDNSLIAHHQLVEDVYHKLNMQSIDELFNFLTDDFAKAHVFEKRLIVSFSFYDQYFNIIFSLQKKYDSCITRFKLFDIFCSIAIGTYVLI